MLNFGQKHFKVSKYLVIMLSFSYMTAQGSHINDSAIGPRPSCDYYWGFVEGYITEVVHIESESRCVGYLENLQVTPSRTCGLDPNLVTYYGLPVSCDIRLGTKIKDYVYYYADQHALWFQGRLHALPQWPSPVDPIPLDW